MTLEAPTSPNDAAHGPTPAANDGALASKVMAEPDTTSVSPARKTKKPAAGLWRIEASALAALPLRYWPRGLDHYHRREQSGGAPAFPVLDRRGLACSLDADTVGGRS
jgi:hypothetical protein